jgi:hypothetical protein
MNMEVTMEISVIKTIIVFFFFNIQLLSSQRVAPIFIGPDSSAVDNSNSKLFLYNVVTNIDRKLLSGIYSTNGPCYSGTGLFRFVVHQNTDVEVISFTGQLPLVLTEILKKRIEATSGMWTPEKRDGTTTHSYPILLFVTFDVVFGDCEKQNNSVITNQGNSEIGYQLEKAFQSGKEDGSLLVVLPKGYLMPVLRFGAIE